MCIVKHKMLRKAILNVRCGLLTFGVVLLYDNARPHTALRSQTLPKYLNCEVFDYPPYCPDLAPSDYRLFTCLKNCLGSQCFNNNEELMKGFKILLSSQAEDFFDTHIQKLIPRYNALIPGITTVRSGLSMYVIFVYNIYFSRLFC
jgi:hypothetical protein